MDTHPHPTLYVFGALFALLTGLWSSGCGGNGNAGGNGSALELDAADNSALSAVAHPESYNSIAIYRSPRFTDDGLRNIGVFTELRKVFVIETGVSAKGISAIAQSCPKLELLNIHSVKIDQSTMESIASLTKLNQLHLVDCTGVSDKAIAKLKNHSSIRTLIIVDAQDVTDTSVAVFCTLKLSRLHLGGTTISQEGVERLLAYFPDCDLLVY